MAAFPSVVAAQSLSHRVAEGFVSASEAYSMAEVADQCLTTFGLETSETVYRTTCRVESVRLLGMSGGGMMYAAQYRRREVSDSSRHAGPMDWDELVILRAGSGSDSVVPQWHIRTERYVELLRDVRAESRTEGLLIELLICLNGTGGCSHEYLLATDELQYVESNVAAGLQELLAEGHYLHKGMSLDLKTLRGTWPVAGPDDRNCCPSLLFDFQARLDGKKMVLVGATLGHPRKSDSARGHNRPN